MAVRRLLREPEWLHEVNLLFEDYPGGGFSSRPGHGHRENHHKYPALEVPPIVWINPGYVKR